MAAGSINHRPLLIKLAAVVVLMSGFTFALVPLYDDGPGSMANQRRKRRFMKASALTGSGW